MTIRERISEMVGDEAVTLLDPESLDEAIVGVFERCGQPPVVVYDYDLSPVLRVTRTDGSPLGGGTSAGETVRVGGLGGPGRVDRPMHTG